MAMRVGLGPVFAFEWRMAARRWQGYALRSLTVILLFGAMAVVWYDSPPSRTAVTTAQQARVGRTFYTTATIALLGLVGLAAPAATAGAICQDKARGNLTLLFATDLSDSEIVLGKLAARLVPVLGLILSAAPVLAIATLFGGIDPVGLTGAVLVVLACAIFGCALALTLSVWGKKTHEVLMMTYVFGILYLLSAPISLAIQSMLPSGWWSPWAPSSWDLLRYNPVFLVIAPVEGPPGGMAPVTIETQAAFLALGLTASSVLILTAIWRIRPVVIRQLGQGERAPGPRGMMPWRPRRARWLIVLVGRVRRAWPRPALDRNPVLWRECQRRRPSGWSLVIWGIYILFCGGFSLQVILLILGGASWGSEAGVMINCIQVGCGLLLLSASAATSLAEERQRGSLDVLMTTPLPTRAIVWGKWWGTFRGVPPLLILPVMVTTAQSFRTGRFWGVAVLAALILAYGAAITSLGLALATWIPRMGRAAAITVGLYTMMCLGWVPLTLIVFGDGPRDNAIGIAAASPLMGVGMYSALLAGTTTTPTFLSQTLWTVFWILTYTGVALALLLATLTTFNRCLGRIDVPTVLDHP